MRNERDCGCNNNAAGTCVEVGHAETELAALKSGITRLESWDSVEAETATLAEQSDPATRPDSVPEEALVESRGTGDTRPEPPPPGIAAPPMKCPKPDPGLPKRNATVWGGPTQVLGLQVPDECKREDDEPDCEDGPLVMQASECKGGYNIPGADRRRYGPSVTSRVVKYKPWKYTVFISGSEGLAVCVGIMIGPKHVLTAAHCGVGFADGVGAGKWMKVAVARHTNVVNNPCFPYSEVNVTHIFQPKAFRNLGQDAPIMDALEDKAYDWRVLVLEKTIFEMEHDVSVPTPSYWSKDENNFWEGGFYGYETFCGAAPKYPSYRAGRLMCAGFPTSFNGFHQVNNGGTLRMAIDAVAGQSGSSIYVQSITEPQKRLLVGVLVGNHQDECQFGLTWASYIGGSVSATIQHLIHLGDDEIPDDQWDVARYPDDGGFFEGTNDLEPWNCK